MLPCRSDLYNVIAFYGISPEEGVHLRIMEICEELATEVNLEVLGVGVTGPGFSGKLRSYKSTKQRLLAAPLVSSVDLMAGPDRDHANAWTYSINAMVNVDADCGVLSANAALLPFNGGDYRARAKQLADVLQPVYGIGYQRQLGYGPSLYALGMSQVPDVDAAVLSDNEERRKITRWGDGMDTQVYRNGILRDVYPVNILSDLQLDKQVSGMPLRRWIDGGTRRGSLTSLTDRLFWWEVPDHDLALVRIALSMSARLFE